MEEKELDNLAERFVMEKMSARDQAEANFGKQCFRKGFEAGYSYYIDLELKHLNDELHDIKKAQETAELFRKLQNMMIK